MKLQVSLEKESRRKAEVTAGCVQVLRTYKGNVSGMVIVTLRDIPLSAGSLLQGETYVFYSNGPSKDRSVGREVSFWSTKPLSQVKPAELRLLSGIDQPPYTGTIFGTLDQHLTPLEWKPLPNVKVLAAKGGKVYSGTTDEKGNFEITDLPAAIIGLALTSAKPLRSKLIRMMSLSIWNPTAA
jgi:hypothetical protein